LSTINCKQSFVSSAWFLVFVVGKSIGHSFIDWRTALNSTDCISSTTLQTVANSSVSCALSFGGYFEKITVKLPIADSIISLKGLL
jgi:hypothetical protein